MSNHIHTSSMSTPAPGALAEAQPVADPDRDAVKHTPIPWAVDYGGTPGHIKAVIKPGKHTPTVARYDIWFDGDQFREKWAESAGYSRQQEKANADFIVEAVNSHDRLKQDCANLLAALKQEARNCYKCGGLVANFAGTKQDCPECANMLAAIKGAETK